MHFHISLLFLFSFNLDAVLIYPPLSVSLIMFISSYAAFVTGLENKIVRLKKISSSMALQWGSLL